MKTQFIAILAVFSLALVVSMGFASAYMGFGLSGSQYNEEVHAQLTDAIMEGDYEQWKALREENGLPMHGKVFQNVNEENFGLYQQLHTAVQNGDTEQASQIREELGLGLGKMFKNRMNGQGHMKHMGQGMQFIDKNGDGICDFHEQLEE